MSELTSESESEDSESESEEQDFIAARVHCTKKEAEKIASAADSRGWCCDSDLEAICSVQTMLLGRISACTFVFCWLLLNVCWFGYSVSGFQDFWCVLFFACLHMMTGLLQITCWNFAVLRCCSPYLCQLVHGSAPRAIEWPTADFVRASLEERLGKDWNHMLLGLTRYAMRDVVMAILDGYERSDTFHWIDSDEVTGYDLQSVIAAFLRQHGLQEFSLAEVLFALGHPGAGMVSVFLSHAQLESVKKTLAICRHYAQTCWPWREPVFWCDYFTLRQCVKDFDLGVVAKTIKEIGHTVLAAEDVFSAPVAVSRTFCVFEIYSSIVGKCKLTVTPQVRPNRCQLCCGVSQPRTKVDLATATCRDERAREDINDLIRETEGGFPAANKLCMEGLNHAFWVEIRAMCINTVTKAVVTCVVIFATLVTYKFSELYRESDFC